MSRFEFYHNLSLLVPHDRVTQGTLGIPLSVTITNAISSSRQIHSFYYHQAEAIDALAYGSHVIGDSHIPDVQFQLTSHESIYTYGFWEEHRLPGEGNLHKLHCGNPNRSKVPMLQLLEKDLDSTFIFIYPTKVPPAAFCTAEISTIHLGIGPRPTCSRSKPPLQLSRVGEHPSCRLRWRHTTGRSS